MKSKLKLILLFLIGIVNAQKSKGIYGETNWFASWTNFKPKAIEYNETTQILIGEIKQNTTLTKRNTYLLMGTVYVTNKATLTIEPGTVIRGDFNSNGTLVIVKGSKIKAEGTITSPIVFTSNKTSSERKAGDWGGVIIYGDAPVNRMGGVIASIYDPNPAFNQFGGTNENDDSGIMKYVRIEFAGKKIDQKTMLNGLTLGAVGNKTKIENIQVSFAKDDAIEVIGGNLELNNIISFNNADDDFDFSMGTQGVINNSIAIRSPFISDNTRSRCLEIDSYDKIENYDQSRKKTIIKLNNVTMVSNEINDQGLVKEAISLKSDSFLEMNNCVVAGFASFIALDDKYLIVDNAKQIKIKDCLADNCKAIFTNEALIEAPEINDLFLKNNSISVSKIGIEDFFISNDIKKSPDFRLAKR